MSSGGRSYWLYVLSLGRESVDRVYVPMDEHETEEGARRTLSRSKRRRVLYVLECHPTSYWQALYEREGSPFKQRRRRR